MTKTFTPTPHDAIVKKFLEDKATAIEFMELYLPLDVKSICNLDSLKIKSGSFIDKDLSQYYNDILFSVETSEGKGYIYCLIEHQTKPDKWISFRLMRYAIAAMEKYLDEKLHHLPLVVPILFYFILFYFIVVLKSTPLK